MDISLKELKNLQKDPLKLSYAVVGAAAVLLAYLLIVKVDLGQKSRLEASIAVKKRNLAVLEKVDSYRQYVKQLNSSYFSPEAESNWLVKLITDTAKKQSINVDLVQPLNVETVQGYEIRRVLVEGRALYYDMADFVKALENSDKYICMEQFILQAEEIKDSMSKDRGGVNPVLYQLLQKKSRIDSGKPAAGQDAGYDDGTKGYGIITNFRYAYFKMVVKTYNPSKDGAI